MYDVARRGGENGPLILVVHASDRSNSRLRAAVQSVCETGCAKFLTSPTFAALNKNEHSSLST